MKHFSTSNQHLFSWEQLCQGFWLRYPNPYSTHVISDDIISQTLEKGRLLTKRLIIKTNSLPKWGERLISGPRRVCVVEESVVDLKHKTLTTYTRNVGYTTLLRVDEKCIYKPHNNNSTDHNNTTVSHNNNSPDSNTTTTCERSAFIECKVRGISSAVQRFALERYKMNVHKSVKGFDGVLRGLFGVEGVLLGGEGRGGRKLRNASEAAKNIASSLVALH